MPKHINWPKRITSFLLSLTLLVTQTLPIFATSRNSEDASSLKIATLSDTHYLSPTMIKDTEDYTDHLNSDRKMFTESKAILNGLLEVIQIDQPDVLMITGDLTKDGELEGHQELAKRLEELKKELPNLHIYITPGNHDLRNSNGMNFNTLDGKAVPATRTNPDDFKECYKNVTYNDETILATYNPPTGKEAGGLSYVARPLNGFTIISIDSARYSKDNTEAQKDEHETSGAISTDLENWILKQINAAKLRGDTVIGMQHHGMIEHFTMEPEVLPMYLVNDYDRLREKFADAGMQYIFTGHMHANDIAEYTTAAGNKLYDIETGSVVTYPSPARSVTIDRQVHNGQVKETMEIETITDIGPVTYTNPLTGNKETINNVTAYGKERGFSNEMLTTTVDGFLNDYYTSIVQNGSKKSLENIISLLVDQIAPEYSSLIKGKTIEELIPTFLGLMMPNKPQNDSKFQYWYTATDATLHINYGEGINAISFNLTAQAIGEAINVIFDAIDQRIDDPDKLKNIVNRVIENITAMEVSQDEGEKKTLLDYVNYIYQSHLAGDDIDSLQPLWVKDAYAYASNGTFVNDLVGLLVNEIGKLIYEVTDLVSVNELLGVKGVDLITSKWQALDNRTPLLQSANDNTDSAIITVWVMLLNARPDNTNPYLYVLDDDYNLTQLLTDASEILESMGIDGFNLDIKAALDTLINGSDGTDGLLDSSLRSQLSKWVVSLVDSFGNDTNYPQDNNTKITYTWNLLTDRSALDQAIKDVKAIDLSLYTNKSAQTVKDALVAAEALSIYALQEEIDEAVRNLNIAVSGLVLLTMKPENNTNSSNTNTPATGDGTALFAITILSITSLAGYLVLKKKNSI